MVSLPGLKRLPDGRKKYSHGVAKVYQFYAELFSAGQGGLKTIDTLVSKGVERVRQTAC